MNRRELIAYGGTALVLTSTGISSANNWPSEPVTVISAYPLGGASNIITRFVADRLTERFGPQFVVEIVSGAAGAMAGGKLTRSALDAGLVQPT